MAKLNQGIQIHLMVDERHLQHRRFIAETYVRERNRKQKARASLTTTCCIAYMLNGLPTDRGDLNSQKDFFFFFFFPFLYNPSVESRVSNLHNNQN